MLRIGHWARPIGLWAICRVLTVFAQRPGMLRTAVAQEPGEDRETRAAVQARSVTARSSTVPGHVLAKTGRQVARFLVEYYPLDDAGERFDRLRV